MLGKVSHGGAGPVEGTQEQQTSNQFSDFEKSKNFTNDADLTGVVTVVLEENNGLAGTNHHPSIFMKSCFEGNETHLPRRVGLRECVCVCVCVYVCVCVCEWVIGTRIAVR